jgi:uncharacterized membrane protein
MPSFAIVQPGGSSRHPSSELEQTMTTSSQTLALASGIGVLAGLRTFIAPAVIGRAARRGDLDLSGTPLRSLQTASFTQALAIGEMIADKLPKAPKRTSAAPLAARMASGAVCGAAVSAARGEPLTPGVLFGAPGALAGTYLAYPLRRKLTHDLGLPDLVVAVAEDFVAVRGSNLLVSRV